MTSKKQIEANRKNAQRSTGPKTPEGKARSSLNARMHGFTAKRLILEAHERSAFDQMFEALVEEFEPTTPYAYDLLDELAHCRWQRMHIRELNVAILDFDHLKRMIDEHPALPRVIVEPPNVVGAFTLRSEDFEEGGAAYNPEDRPALLIKRQAELDRKYAKKEAERIEKVRLEMSDEEIAQIEHAKKLIAKAGVVLGNKPALDAVCLLDRHENHVIRREEKARAELVRLQRERARQSSENETLIDLKANTG